MKRRHHSILGIAALLAGSVGTLSGAQQPQKKPVEKKPAPAAASRMAPKAPARGKLTPTLTRLRPQIGAQAGLAPISSTAVGFGVSPQVRDIPPEKTKPDEGDRYLKIRDEEEFRTEKTSDGLGDPVIQTSAPVLAIPGPSLGFDGMNNADNSAAFGFRLAPPDTDGDVGPNHYVQQVNLLVRVFDKAGVPLTPPFKLSSLWSTVGGECAEEDKGDPIVLYDPLADRWLLSQFAFASDLPPYHECIAVSKTPDPAGAYFLYDFVTPGANFPDYPKLGVWPDGYYMTDNQFFNGASFNGAGVFAFNRAKMLAGDPTANFIYFNLDLASHPEGVGGMLPSDFDGLTPPPVGKPNTFSYFTAAEFGDPGDALRLFDFHADFAVPGLSTFTERPESPLAVAPFDPLSPSGRADIRQPPPSTAAASLDAISDRLMHRLQYRNLGGSESLVVNHTVNVSGISPPLQVSYQAGIRYYELRRSGAGPWTIHEQATFAPADGVSRWMGSAATDNNGNLAIGYSVSSVTTFPGVRYAGRLASDPPGGLFQGENTLIAGSGVQLSNSGGTASRWGDYSALAVDPVDDCTFWYTQEYYTAASQATSTVGWLTRIGNFKFAECTPAPKGTLQGAVTNAATGLPITGALVQTGNGFSRMTDGGGNYSMSVAPGTYSMTASKFGFMPANASGVVVSDGGTTVKNFALTPVAIPAAAGSALTAENCNPHTGVIDPGERVTVAFSINNIGAANTSNLVATLMATGGVTSPTGPQSYGVVMAGGPAVTKSFSFTASSSLLCGGTLTATLSLKDGAVSLGTLSYTFTLGALSTGAASSTTSTGNIAVFIADNSTVDIPIPVSDATGTSITDVNVSVRLNHTFDSDLTIELVHPDGTVVTLADGRGGAGDNFGTGANDCSGTPTVFDDSAGSPVSAGVAPFAGSFRPDQALSAFNGKPTSGTWKLRVTDGFTLDTGTVGCVKLSLTRRMRLCCPFTGGSPIIGAVPPATVVAESCGTPNGVADPGETVTVGFPLQNVGSGLTTNLVATLLPGGGVNGPSAPQSYGSLSPLGAPVSRNFTFSASGTCGGNVTATLQLQDGPTSLGTAVFTLTLGTTATTPFGPFSNPAPITILDTPRVGGVAKASPYPSTITVAGVVGSVSKVTVTLTGLGHTFPNDIDILLVGPGGQKILLMSDAGGGTAISGRTLTFDDAAAAAVPTPIVSGTFRPTNISTGDTFPAPAPAGPYPDPQLLSAFNGVNPNGTWSLYIVDDVGADSGSISGGWSLAITTAVPVCESCFFLRESGGTLFLDGGPTGSATKSRDTGVSSTGGNPWKSFGTWTASPPFEGMLNSAGPWRGWIQLTNSDAIGLKADVMVELQKNGSPIGSGLLRCIQGIARNADKEIMVPFGAFPPTSFSASDSLSLKVLARVGTNPDGTKCPGHNSGPLRINFDSHTRPSSFEGN